MTNPLLGSPGSSAIKTSGLDQSSGSRQLRSGNGQSDDGNGNSFGKVVRDLSSESNATRDGASGSRQASDPQRNNPSSEAKQSLDGLPNANGRAADGSSNQNAIRGNVAAGLQNPDSQIRGRQEELDSSNGKGDASSLVQPGSKRGTIDRTLRSDLSSLDFKTRDEAVDQDVAGEETALLDAADQVPAVSSLLSSDKLKSAEANGNGIKSDSRNGTGLSTDEDGLKADREVRLNEGGNARSSIGPTGPGSDALLRASLDGRTDLPANAEGRVSGRPVEQGVLAQLADGAVKNAVDVNSSIDAVQRVRAEVNAPAQVPTQAAATNFQLRSLGSAAGVPDTGSEVSEGQQNDRSPQFNVSGRGAADADLAKLLNERRVAENAAVRGLLKPGAAEAGAAAQDNINIGEEEDLESRLLSVMREDGVQNRALAQAGAGLERNGLDLAGSITRQISQGMAGPISMWVGTASSYQQGGTGSNATGDMPGGRGLSADFGAQLNAPPPGAMRSLRLQLQPASLGTVTAHLTMKNDELHVRFVAEKVETSELIQSQRNVLLAQLVEAGVEVNSANVEIETARTNNGRQGAYSGFAGGSNGFADGGFGNADGSRHRSGNEHGTTGDGAPLNDDTASGDGSGLANQRSSVVYL